MKTARLNQMTKGWFIGNFDPSLYKTNDVEVAIKSYKANEHEDKHHHEIATEFTVVTKGKIHMFGRDFSEGDIIVCEPGDSTDFTAITDAQNVIIKIPSASNDKYMD